MCKCVRLFVPMWHLLIQGLSELTDRRHLVHLTFQNIYSDMRAATLSLSADSADGQTKRQPWHDIRARNILSGAIGVDFNMCTSTIN